MSVYHGSEHHFEIAKPSWTRRVNINREVVYKGVSLHATPHKWIGLAYTAKKGAGYIHKGKKLRFNMGVSLHTNNMIVHISGKKSLEYSLDKLYGDGGYLYTFDANKFKHVKDLGELEVLSYNQEVPKKIEFIKNPVKEMEKLGVIFRFHDGTK